MMELDCIPIEIANPKSLTLFGSEWLSSALDRHKGLDKAILCDVYDVMYLPNGKLITNLGKSSTPINVPSFSSVNCLAENAKKIFGEENIKEKNRGKAYATRIIEQKGMAVSVSQYGRNARIKKNENNENKETKDDKGLVLFVDDEESD